MMEQKQPPLPKIKTYPFDKENIARVLANAPTPRGRRGPWKKAADKKKKPIFDKEAIARVLANLPKPRGRRGIFKAKARPQPQPSQHEISEATSSREISQDPISQPSQDPPVKVANKPRPLLSPRQRKPLVTENRDEFRVLKQQPEPSRSAHCDGFVGKEGQPTGRFMPLKRPANRRATMAEKVVDNFGTLTLVAMKPENAIEAMLQQELAKKKKKRARKLQPRLPSHQLATVEEQPNYANSEPPVVHQEDLMLLDEKPAEVIPPRLLLDGKLQTTTIPCQQAPINLTDNDHVEEKSAEVCSPLQRKRSSFAIQKSSTQPQMIADTYPMLPTQPNSPSLYISLPLQTAHSNFDCHESTPLKPIMKQKETSRGAQKAWENLEHVYESIQKSLPDPNILTQPRASQQQSQNGGRTGNNDSEEGSSESEIDGQDEAEDEQDDEEEELEKELGVGAELEKVDEEVEEGVEEDNIEEERATGNGMTSFSRSFENPNSSWRPTQVDDDIISPVSRGTRSIQKLLQRQRSLSPEIGDRDNFLRNRRQSPEIPETQFEH